VEVGVDEVVHQHHLQHGLIAQLRQPADTGHISLIAQEAGKVRHKEGNKHESSPTPSHPMWAAGYWPACISKGLLCSQTPVLRPYNVRCRTHVEIYSMHVNLGCHTQQALASQ